VGCSAVAAEQFRVLGLERLAYPPGINSHDHDEQWKGPSPSACRRGVFAEKRRAGTLRVTEVKVPVERSNTPSSD
jgi:hypothetical protein